MLPFFVGKDGGAGLRTPGEASSTLTFGAALLCGPYHHPQGNSGMSFVPMPGPVSQPFADQGNLP